MRVVNFERKRSKLIINALRASWCPWIPGLSFMTDGVQCKLPLVSVRNNRTPGLSCLYDRGFTGFKRAQPIEQINIGSVKNGVYVPGKQEVVLNNDDLKNHAPASSLKARMPSVKKSSKNFLFTYSWGLIQVEISQCP